MRITYAEGAPVVVFNPNDMCEVVWLARMRIFATVTRKLLRKRESEIILLKIHHAKKMENLGQKGIERTL